MFKKNFLKFKFLKFSFLFFLFLTLFFIVRKETLYNFLQKKVLQYGSFVQIKVFSVVNFVKQKKQKILSVDQLYKEHALLKQEYLKILNENHQNLFLKQSFDDLKKILKINVKNELKPVACQVIAWDVLEDRKIIKINKGFEDGIKKDSFVVGFYGVVGKVVEVFSNYSEVLTVLDESFQVDVTDERNLIKGIYQGKSGNLGYLKYIARKIDIIVGQKLYTAGVGGIFPKGIPLGQVVSVEKNDFNLVQKIIVQPFETIPFAEFVLVYASL